MKQEIGPFVSQKQAIRDPFRIIPHQSERKKFDAKPVYPSLMFVVMSLDLYD
jgi:hypothetical protein